MKHHTKRSWFHRHRRLLFCGSTLFAGTALYADLFGGDDVLLGQILGENTISATQAVKDLELATTMAMHIKDKQFMESVAVDAAQIEIQDHYGETVTLMPVLNGVQSGNAGQSAQAAANAWKQATSDAGDPSYLSGQTPGQSSSLAHLASIGLADGAVTSCLQTMGGYQKNLPANQIAMQLLMKLHLSTGDSDNTQVTQQNIQNGFSAQMLNELRSSNALGGCGQMLQAAQLKFRRDQEAEELEQESQMAAQPVARMGGSHWIDARANAWGPQQ